MTWFWFITLGILALAIRAKISRWLAMWQQGMLSQTAWVGVLFFAFMALFGWTLYGKWPFLHFFAAVIGILGFFSISEMNRRSAADKAMRLQQKMNSVRRKPSEQDTEDATGPRMYRQPVVENVIRQVVEPEVKQEEIPMVDTSDRLMSILTKMATMNAAGDTSPIIDDDPEGTVQDVPDPSAAPQSSADRVKADWAKARHAHERDQIISVEAGPPAPDADQRDRPAAVTQPDDFAGEHTAADEQHSEPMHLDLSLASTLQDTAHTPDHENLNVETLPDDADARLKSPDGVTAEPEGAPDAGAQLPESGTYQTGASHLSRKGGPFVSGPVTLGGRAGAPRTTGPVSSLGRGFGYKPQLVRSILDDKLDLTKGSDDEAPVDSQSDPATETGEDE